MLSFEERQQLKQLVSAGRKKRLKNAVFLNTAEHKHKMSERSSLKRAELRFAEGLEADGPSHFKCMHCDMRSAWNGHIKYRHKEGCQYYRVQEGSSDQEESSKAA